MQFRCLISLSFLFITSIGYTQMPKGTPYGFPQKTGTLQQKKLDEISGMASSRFRSDILWMINDSGNQAELYAVKSDGTLVATYKLNVDNEDWEDMSSFRMGKTSAWINSWQNNCRMYHVRRSKT